MRRVVRLIGLALLALPAGGERPPRRSVTVDRARVAQLTLNLRLSSAERIRAASARSGMSMAAYISASVGCATWNATFAGAVVTVENSGRRFLTQLPAPGLETPCPCHPPGIVPDDRSVDPTTETVTAKITHEAREAFKGLARHNPGAPLTLQDFIEASTWVEQWNYDHRDCRITVERPDGRYELLLPYAGIVHGRVATAR